MFYSEYVAVRFTLKIQIFFILLHTVQLSDKKILFSIGHKIYISMNDGLIVMFMLLYLSISISISTPPSIRPQLFLYLTVSPSLSRRNYLQFA